MVTIFIQLLDEGTEVFRPTAAELVKNDLFKVLGEKDSIPADEKWEFPPGSLVRCEKRILDNEQVLVAVERRN